MKNLTYLLLVTALIGHASCSNSTKSNPAEADSVLTEMVSDFTRDDTTSTRGDSEVFGAETPTTTELQSEGFGRCLQSGCYCKKMEGRGETCRNCGHAYKKHY